MNLNASILIPNKYNTEIKSVTLSDQNNDEFFGMHMKSMCG